MHPVLKALAYLCTALIAAVCGMWAYFAARQFSLITVVVAVGILTTYLLSMRMVMMSTDVVPQASFSSEGTTLKPDARVDRAHHQLVVVGTLSSALCVVAAWPVGVLYVPLDDLSYVVPVVVGAFGLALLWMWWQRAHFGAATVLYLTPEAVEFPTLVRVQREVWDDVVDINDRMPSGDEEFWNPMVFTRKDGKHLRFEAPGIYTPKGTALVALVRFYWQHPSQRDELTDGRAVQRLQHEMSTERP